MANHGLTRREALLGLGGLSGLSLIDALWVEPNWLDVPNVDVPVARLPRRLDGFRIAQITDAHLRQLGSVEEGILEMVKHQNVQVVALTGDIIDSADAFGMLREFCSRLAGTGTRIVATLGNWEHWGKVPLESLRALYDGFGVQLLVNDRVVIDGVTLSATDDATAGQVNFRGALPTAQGDARVLLTHSPAILDEIPADVPRFDLAMAGHTHGGQVRLTSAVVPFTPPGSGRFVAGWYETPAGPAYVSRGTGTSIAPVRFTCRPELPVFELRQG